MTRPATAKLLARSQTVILKLLLEHLGIEPGDMIAFEERDGQIVIRPVRPASGADPFVLFSEWSGEADERAYADF